MVGELRDQILEDTKMFIQEEFGQEMAITRPDGSDRTVFIGTSNDISRSIDDDTGLLINGRKVHVVFRYGELNDAFGELPGQGWVVEFIDLSFGSLLIKDIYPDATMGIVEFLLKT